MGLWDPHRLTNLLRSIREPPSSGVPFGIRMKNVLKRGGGGGAYIQDGGRGQGGSSPCSGLKSLNNLTPCTQQNGATSENGHLAIVN